MKSKAAPYLLVLALVVLGVWLITRGANSKNEGKENSGAAPGPAAVQVPETVVVDLSGQLPKQVDLVVGGGVLFENGLAQIEAKEIDGNGQLLEPRPHNTFNQAAAFRATRVGVGEITVTFPNQGLLTVIRTYTIKVVVK